MWWIRSRSLLLLIFLTVAVLLSVYKLNSYTSESDHTVSKISEHVRGGKVNLFENPCLCNQKFADLSNESTIFQAKTFPDDKCCKPSIGNGFLATVVYSDRIHMNGLYNGYAGFSHRARIPSTAAVTYNLTGKATAKTESYTLDVKQGVFVRFTQTNGFNITQRVYAHQYLTRLIINDITIARDPGAGGGDFVLALHNNSGLPSADISFKKSNSNHTDVRYMFGNTVEAETDTSGTLPCHVYWTLVPPNITLPSSESSYTWTFITAISNSSSDAESFYTLGQKALSDGVLFKKHHDSWFYKWSQGSIDVDVDVDLAKAIYGSMYYILSSLPPLKAATPHANDFHFYGLSPASLASGDLSGNSYKGHVFWDQETWMYPGIMLFHPDLAKRMLQSRTMHMDAAAAMAKSSGYQGLKFPWEIAYSGFEVCPAAPFSSNELHINGDIALAVQQYLQLTGDTNFLTKQGGTELIEGLAKFWASKAEYNSTADTYSIKDVMGPDEYHQNVTDSVYTNSIAQISLRLPSLAAQLLRMSPSPKWLDIANKLVIPFDPKRNYHPEFAGYQFKTRIKQADVILLGYPLTLNLSSTVRKNDLHYYDTVDGYHVTDINGPAMTWSMYVVGWLEINNHSNAEKSFKKSLLNLQQPFKVWTEEATGYGAVNFITGMGGFLQSIVYGYAGFRILPNSLNFNFTLPSTSKTFNITGVYYMGNKLDFRVAQTSLLLNRTSILPNGSDLEVEIAGKTYSLDKGKPVTSVYMDGVIRKAKMSISGKRPKNRQKKIRPDTRKYNKGEKRLLNVMRWNKTRLLTNGKLSR